MGKRHLQPGIRTASESTIEIDFRYRGVRCRGRLNLPPTARNLAYAGNLRGQILTEIAKGTFDYRAHFPDSARAEKLDPGPTNVLLVETALDRWYKAKALELEHSTLDDYRRIIDRVLVPAMGSKPVGAVTRQASKDRKSTSRNSKH